MRSSLARVRHALRRRRAQDGAGVAGQDLEELKQRLNRQRSLIDRRGRQVDDLRESVRMLRLMRQDFDRLGAQVAALEERVADLHEPGAALSPYPPSDDPAVLEVRERLGEVRREHEQVRARFGVLVAYEERIRRLEENAFGSVPMLDEP